MVEEAYCSYKVSKLLKEKGFDEECRSYFVDNGDTFRNCAVHIKLINCTSDQILRPTQQMAMAWLRGEKGIFINILYREVGYRYEIVEMDSGIKYSGYWVNSYEEAVEAALKYCLENLV